MFKPNQTSLLIRLILLLGFGELKIIVPCNFKIPDASQFRILGIGENLSGSNVDDPEWFSCFRTLNQMVFNTYVAFCTTDGYKYIVLSI